MTGDTSKVQHLPEYARLTQARHRIVWPLAIVTVVGYFGLILTIAFSPASLGQPIGNGVTSIGVVLGLGIILLCFVVTGVYVYYANHVIEPLTRVVIAKQAAIVKAEAAQ